MFICIEGNIGSGKSTLAQALAKKLKATYLPEQFEDNTLLPLFYNDNATFAFPTEYSFLIDRQKQLTNYFKKVKKAWIFKKESQTFSEIPIKGIDCINDEFDNLL